MAKVKRSEPRSTIREEGGKLLVLIPVRRNVGLTLFLSVWICGWAAGEIATLSTIHDWFWIVPIWLVGWTFAGCYLLYCLLRLLCGREVLTFSLKDNLFTTRQEVLGFGRIQTFALDRVHDFRVCMRAKVRSHGLVGMGLGVESLAFHYDTRHYHVGFGLDEAEAKLIVAAVVKRYPKIGSPDDHSFQALVPVDIGKCTIPISARDDTAIQASSPVGKNAPVLTIYFRSRRPLAWLVFWGVWVLTVWPGGIIQLLSDPRKGALYFLCFWVPFGLVVVIGVLSNCLGRESISISEQRSMLVSRWELFGWVWSHEFDLRHVSTLRVSPVAWDRWHESWLKSRDGNDRAIAFDYGAGTHRIGWRIDERDAQSIITEILNRFPELGEDRASADSC
jgi:hypothetical protein